MQCRTHQRLTSMNGKPTGRLSTVGKSSIRRESYWRLRG
ncbi:hypothetical protein MAR_024614 [Mya arenaria]|uniref:Uncharacterized protein n=1 Tax=Mya arenaria TaxID=6604 RepID=A0ABY7DTS4_MYAAR|nr:hypothetical protein MAR_024614 [Mya arenaria]